jgi:hypothetical protein
MEMSKDGHVWQQLAHAADGLAPVGRLAGHLHVGLRVEEHPQALADHPVVFGEKDSQLPHGHITHGRTS